MNPAYAPHDVRRPLTAAPDECFPLQRRCTLRGSDDQAEFAREATEVLSPDDTACLEATPSGLLLLAQNQVAQRRLSDLVQAVYGKRVEFGPLEIRYREEGGVRMEPQMSLRINCRVERRGAVVADLKWREANLLDERTEGARVVLRVTAPLVLLLGYPTLLARIDASATLTSWLAFYARVGLRARVASV